MEQEGLSITEVARGLNIPERRLLDWEVKGFLTPRLVRRGHGRRVVRRYPPQLVERARRLKDLVDKGYRLKKAVELVDAGTIGEDRP